MHCHEQMLQEPWRSRWPQERDVGQSAPTHACHTHCASRQLGTRANQRCVLPRDWLWDAWQMARVHWGTRCKGFFCKEGPQYWIEQKARSLLEHKQVQNAWGIVQKLSSDRQQSTWFTSLEIPSGFFAQAVLHWLSWGLCQARKCQFEDTSMWEEKVWFAIA